MRTLLAWFASVLLSSAASATVDPPFVPPSGAVDHVVTVVDTIAGRRAPLGGVRRLTHRAGWTRVEWVHEGRSKTRGFAGPGTTVLLSLPFDVRIDVPPSLLMIHRVPAGEASARIERSARKTGEKRVVLGETCAVWNGVPFGNKDSENTRESCVTEDGVELASRVVRPDGSEVSSTEATHVQRRPVREDEARPPASLLSVASWVGPEHLVPAAAPRADGASANHEVTLRAGAQGLQPLGERATAVSGRYGDWTYYELSQGPAVVALSIENRQAGFGLLAYPAMTDRPATLTLLLSARPSDQGGPRTRGEAEAKGVVRTGRVTQVLGEACEYVEVPLRPGVTAERCRTRDGIVLKERTRSDGRYDSGAEAVELRRGGTSLPSTISRSSALDPALWGFLP